MSGVILLTPGDPRGIGPEITLKALKAQTASVGQFTIVVMGAEAPFKKLRAQYERVTVDDLLSSSGSRVWSVRVTVGGAAASSVVTIRAAIADASGAITPVIQASTPTTFAVTYGA